MAKLILNCDLGENESLQQTETLLSLVDAANISCGFHAGSPDKTRASIELALKYGVKIGAHPGLTTDGGRGQDLPTAQEFNELLDLQFSSFQASAQALGTRAAYIKLHGSLYHAVETQPELAQVYIGFLSRQDAALAIFTLAQGRFAAIAQAAGLRIYQEAFADREYLPDGSLLPRSEEGAVLSQDAALKRFQTWKETGMFPTRGGSNINFSPDTLCVHGDSPDAIALIRNIRALC